MRILRSGPRLWMIAFAGFFLLSAAWTFATPYNGPPDEWAHALRGAAVAHGEVFPQHGFHLVVPDGLWPRFKGGDPGCFVMQVTVPASCTPEPGGNENWSSHRIPAAPYNPVYYAVTGWPLALWPNWTGIYLARLLTGAVMAALMAGAVVAGTLWTRHRAVLAGLAVAITPELMSLGGAINPNGVEIAAGVGLCAGLIPLLLERHEKLNRSAVALVAISASVLVTPRSLGFLWLGVILVPFLIGTPWAHLRSLARERTVRRWGAVAGVFMLASIAWLILLRPIGGTLPLNLGLSWKDVLKSAFLDEWPNVANQMVGGTGWSEVLQPRLVYLVWFMAFGLLVLGGFVVGGKIDKWRIILLAVGTFGPLLGVELLIVNHSGWFSQGRYFLPAAVGLPMLGAHAMAKHGLNAAHFRSMTRTLAVLLLPIQLVVLAYTMSRWQSGLKILDPLKGSWHPLVGSALPLALGVLAVLVLLFMYWGGSRLPTDGPATASSGTAGPTADAEAERREPAFAGSR